MVAKPPSISTAAGNGGSHNDFTGNKIPSDRWPYQPNTNSTHHLTGVMTKQPVGTKR
jgi:hypothetical protein